jgi:tyrosyl-tRNA synthetase
MLTQGGVSVDGDPMSDLDVDASALDGRIVRAGKKRFARIRVA